MRQGLNPKRYPLRYVAHRTIDTTLDIAECNDVQPNDVQHVRVFTGSTQFIMLHNEQPQNAFEVKIGMPFVTASALVKRNVGLAQMTDAFICSPTVQSLFSRVGYETTTDTLDGSAFAQFDAVEIVTKDSTRWCSENIPFAKGSHQ